MSDEMCENVYDKSLTNSSSYNKNKHFSNKLNNIFKEMYVEEELIPICQHMVEKSGEFIFFSILLGILTILSTVENLMGK